MPIHEADPWRLQYFAHVATEVDITTEDGDAWQWYPAHRWVYDKLAVAQSQGLVAGPHGTRPPRFPVFSKPIVNLKGMGIGCRVLRSQADYEPHAAPGHFWMRLLEGRHVSSDLAVVDGKPRWWRHVTGRPAGEGTFDYWTIQAEPEPEIGPNCTPCRRGAFVSPWSMASISRPRLRRGRAWKIISWKDNRLSSHCGGETAVAERR